MTSMNSRPVTQQVVYPQDTQPVDERDGVMWIDTSQESRPLYVYSEGTAAWEPVKTDVPVLVTQEAVTFDEADVYTGFTNTDKYPAEGVVRMIPDPIGPVTSRSPDNDSFSSSNDTGVRIETNRLLDGVYGSVSANTTGITRAYLFRIEDDGTRTRIADTAINSGSFQFDMTLEAGRQYDITADAEGSSFTKGRISGHSAPHAGDALDIVAGSGDDANSIWCVNDIGSMQADGTGDAGVRWSEVPDDLTTWDIFTWQYDEMDGSLSFQIRTNQSGTWETYASGVLPPFDISGIDPTADIRLISNYDVTAGRSPRLTYSARRGER